MTNFIFLRRTDNIESLNIIILLKKPLGLGDLIMLSPLVKILENKAKTISILSEYDEFIIFDNVNWIKSYDKKKYTNEKVLFISPTFTFSHLKYAFYGNYFVGYFFSNKLVSNIKKCEYKYNPKSEHYLEKIFPILDILEIIYDKKNFTYPHVKTKEVDVNVNDYILIAPYSNWHERQYPRDNFIRLIDQLLEVANCKIIIVGSPSKKEINFNKSVIEKYKTNRIINLTGKTNILEMNYLIKNCNLYIGNDSGPSNIAYITAPKSLVFFGSVSYENRLPLNEKLSTFIYAFDSRGDCDFFPCYNGYDKPNCKSLNRYVCLKNTCISSEKLKELLIN